MTDKYFDEPLNPTHSDDSTETGHSRGIGAQLADCPACTDRSERELDWLWALDPDALRRLLEGAGAIAIAAVNAEIPAYTVEMRSLALHLIIDAPTGPPTCTHEFIARCVPDTLATAWGITWDDVRPVDHPSTVEIQIAAVTEERALINLVAEFSNLFRHWAAHPDHARACADSAVRTLY
ncbi:hypothetical protein VMT65_31215 [Nocardia sp. CDC153]|uniref:hypothetical protein n=1 Tax=Nocardia sp. CDC153 TaxID=3112167 RepID=UPI002DBAA1BE|nr:hypothetical protein [Nocardia sp. CDC153]MEC3957540.1 hypothetical protein [Nocardia sp. CDC153]